MELKHAVMASIRRLPFTDGSKKPRRGKTPLAGKTGKPEGGEQVGLSQTTPPTLEQTRQVLNGEIIRLNDRLHLTPLNGDKEYDVGYPGDAIDRERARNEKKMKERRV